MSHSRSRLRSLIRAANDAGVTYEKMAAATDGLISRGKLHKMAMQAPVDGEIPLTVPQLRALATAIGQPWHVVRDAVLADAGLDDARDSDSSANVTGAILTDPRLLPEARSHLLNQYQLLLRLEASPPEEVAEQQQRRDEAWVQQQGRALLEAVPTEPPARERANAPGKGSKPKR